MDGDGSHRMRRQFLPSLRLREILRDRPDPVIRNHPGSHPLCSGRRGFEAASLLLAGQRLGELAEIPIEHAVQVV